MRDLAEVCRSEVVPSDPLGVVKDRKKLARRGQVARRLPSAGERRRPAVLAGEHVGLPPLTLRPRSARRPACRPTRSTAALTRLGLDRQVPTARGSADPLRRAALSRRPSSADRLPRRGHPSAAGDRRSASSPRGRRRLCGRRRARGDLVGAGRLARAARTWPTPTSPRCGTSRASSWNASNGRASPPGRSRFERKLPNGVSFGARITPTRDEVRMKLWITNGTKDLALGPGGAELRDAQGRRGLRCADQRQQGLRQAVCGLPQPRRKPLDHHGLEAVRSRLGATRRVPVCTATRSSPTALRARPAHPRLALVLRGERRQVRVPPYRRVRMVEGRVVGDRTDVATSVDHRIPGATGFTLACGDQALVIARPASVTAVSGEVQASKACETSQVRETGGFRYFRAIEHQRLHVPGTLQVNQRGVGYPASAELRSLRFGRSATCSRNDPVSCGLFARSILLARQIFQSYSMMPPRARIA